MKNDQLEELFHSMDLDIAEPSRNHRRRFEEKLEQNSQRKLSRSGVISLWLPGLAIAASFLIVFLLFQGGYNEFFIQKGELASVSPEMKDTQNFYASVIQKELESLEEEKSPETENIIRDALKQMSILENDYEKLQTDLVKSGHDRRVIHAMISNFQQRIDLLNQVLEKVNTINELKNLPHENNFL